MIINDKDAYSRLNSPINLINKLRNLSDKKNNAMSLFGIGKRTVDIQVETKINSPEKQSFNPFQSKEPVPPELSSLEVLPQSSQVPLVVAQTNLDNILQNNESQIKLGLAHDKALDLLNRSVEMLSLKLEDVKADRLPSVIAAASKTVEGIRKERNESAKNNKDREVHYHFYTPQQKQVSDYEVIDVA